MQNVPDSFINWFRFAAPYISKHRGATFVIALPGEALVHPNFINLVHDLAMLQSLGARLIIVQGARLQISEALDQAGIGNHIEAGVRVSASEAMPRIISAANLARTELESAMSAGLVDSPMYQLNLKTLSGNFVSAKPLGVRNGIDYGFTGLVRQVDAGAIHTALDSGAAVICNTLGYSPTGEVFNLSLSDTAAEIAKSVSADKIIGFVSDMQLKPLLNSTVVQPTRAHELGAAVCDEASLIDALADAVDSGVERAHFISFEENGGLIKELFTHDGAGLLITKNSLDLIRNAEPSDVGAILELIQPLEETGALVRRTRDLLEEQIQSFAVIDIDGTVAGCAALHILDAKSAEIACMAIHPQFQKRGHASGLYAYLMKRAENASLEKVFALSTQTAQWFKERGFIEATPDNLPLARLELYNSERNSKVLVKTVN